MHITSATSASSLPTIGSDSGLDRPADLGSAPLAVEDGVDATPDWSAGMFGLVARSDGASTAGSPELTVNCPPGQAPALVPIDEDSATVVCTDRGTKKPPAQTAPKPEPSPAPAPNPQPTQPPPTPAPNSPSGAPVLD